MNDSATRRLAAILAADIVGYSRLVEADEAATLARMKALRSEVIDPEIAARRGRVFKTMGDGFLAEFASVVDAVACAAAIQRGSASAPGPIKLRIGVNLGDVVAEGGDLLGDGVNVAARLEGIADPGGLCISGAAYEHLKGKLDLDFDDLGPQKLKNLQQPVRVFRARLDADAAPMTRKVSPLGLAVAAAIAGLSMFGWAGWVFFAPEKTITPPSRQVAARPVAPADDQRPALIVLPFSNLSNDPEQEYFSDGFTEDLTTALSRFPGFLVMARNTAFTFKGKAVDAQQIGRDLGVRYVLEGSVRKQGDRLRLNAQLIDTATGAHVWAEKYDRPMAEIFIAQDEIADKIVGTVASHLRQIAGQKALAAPPEKLEAYDLTMRARLLRAAGGRDDVLEARKLVERAIARDPTFAPAYIILTRALGGIYINRWNDEYAAPGTLDRMIAASSMAATLAPDDPVARALYGYGLALSRNFDAALAEIDAALTLSPNDTDVLGISSTTLVRSGRYEQTIEVVRRAMMLDPFLSPTYSNAMAYALISLGRFDEGADAARYCVRRSPTNSACRVSLVVAMAHLGQASAARDEADILERISPGFTVSADRSQRAALSRDIHQVEVFADGLRKAGVPE